jgi:hypothetical protein
MLEGLLGVARFVALSQSSRLPGLEAQVPGSDTLRSLDAIDSPQRWFSIGANYEPAAEAGIDPLPDSTPNDLVVPSDGCHLPTATPDDSLRIAGSQTHHHNYFASAVARERLAAWLL